MADGTHIEWTDATWNPVTGCTIVSPGCTNCYAMKLAGTRLKHHPSRSGLTVDSKAGPVWNGKVRLNRQWLFQPIDWKKPRRIFVCAHGDLFHESVPDEWILDVFTVMAIAEQHTFQVLTKRAERMHDFVSRPDLLEDIYANWYTFSGGAREVQNWPLPNVWHGCSAEDQQRYDQRRHWLDNTPAAVRFWSIEPMLGPIDMSIQHVKPDLVIVGGESGGGSRPMHPDWARQIRDQCAAAGVPFFFKQWGSWSAVSQMSEDDIDRCYPPLRERHPDETWHCLVDHHVLHADGSRRGIADRNAFLQGSGAMTMFEVGKKRAGRLLDGIEHNGMPQLREVSAL